VLDTGAEVISGSTRLKAGTAQKIALNTLSSALMVRLHKVYGNLMVDLRASNAKLRARALRLTVRASGAGEDEARRALAACDGQVKTAIVMLRAGLDAAGGRARGWRRRRAAWTPRWGCLGRAGQPSQDARRRPRLDSAGRIRCPAPARAGRLPRRDGGADDPRQQPRQLAAPVPAAGARALARLHAHRPRLPLLPLRAVGNAMAISMPAWFGRRGRRRRRCKIVRRTALIFAHRAVPEREPLRALGRRGRARAAQLGDAARDGRAAAHRAGLGRGRAHRLAGRRTRGRVGQRGAAAGLLAGLAFAQGGDPYSLEGFFGTARGPRAAGRRAPVPAARACPSTPRAWPARCPRWPRCCWATPVGRAVVQGPLDDALLVRLFMLALGLLVLAWAWQLVMPLNKKIWSSSYVLLTTGLACAGLAALLRSVELRGARPAWVGCARRTAAMRSSSSCSAASCRACSRCCAGRTAPTRRAGRAGSRRCPGSGAASSSRWAPGWGDPRLGSLAFACANLALYTLLVIWMDRRGLFVRV
jgi:hypothetical protein